MRDHLTTLVSGRKEELNKMGQIYGLQYSASDILWHPTLKQVVCPVRQTYYDWMHVLIASGGLAQYEINQFVKEIRGLGIALKQLDEFASAVVLPKSRTELPSTFFQDRLVEDDDSCIRGFASEMLICITILSLFTETVLKPAGLLPNMRRVSATWLTSWTFWGNKGPMSPHNCDNPLMPMLFCMKSLMQGVWNPNTIGSFMSLRTLKRSTSTCLALRLNASIGLWKP